ncbi:acyl-CoA dehydrogenase, partial [Streptomyces decoyicus]
MDFEFGCGDEEFRAEAREWLESHLVGAYAELVGRGGPGSEHEGADARRAWERELGAGGWIGLGWECAEGAYGNRSAGPTRQGVGAEEDAGARAPGGGGDIGGN